MKKAQFLVIILVLCMSTIYANDNNPKMRTSFSGGLGYLFGNSGDFFAASNVFIFNSAEHVDKLRLGYNLSADCHFFSSEKFALGLEYSFNKHSNKDKDSDAEDKIKLHYIGPSALFYFKNKNCKYSSGYFVSASVGYSRLKNDKNMLFLIPLPESIGSQRYIEILKTKQTGNSVGFNLGFGYEAGLSKCTALIIKMNGLFTWFGSYKNKFEDSDSSKYSLTESDNFSNLKLTVGLRFFR